VRQTKNDFKLQMRRWFARTRCGAYSSDSSWVLGGAGPIGYGERRERRNKELEKERKGKGTGEHRGRDGKESRLYIFFQKPCSR